MQRFIINFLFGICFLFLIQSVFIQEAFIQEAQAECPAYPDCLKCPECKGPKDPTAWIKSLALGFNLTDGNSNTSLLNIRARANQEKANNIWIFDIQHGWGESSNNNTDLDETTVDFTRGLAQYKRLLTERFYTGLGLDALRDEIADIKYRAIPGLIFGYFVVKNDDYKLALEAGPAYVFEEVGGIEDDYFAPRVADRFDWKLSKTASIFQTADVIFDINDSDNYVVNAEAGVTAALNSFLNLVLSVKNTYDNQPAVDKERNDISVLTALSLNL